VKVPVKTLLEREEGWTYAKYLLTSRNAQIAAFGFSQRVDRVKRIAKRDVRPANP